MLDLRPVSVVACTIGSHILHGKKFNPRVLSGCARAQRFDAYQIMSSVSNSWRASHSPSANTSPTLSTQAKLLDIAELVGVANSPEPRRKVECNEMIIRVREAKSRRTVVVKSSQAACGRGAASIARQKYRLG